MFRWTDMPARASGTVPSLDSVLWPRRPTLPVWLSKITQTDIRRPRPITWSVPVQSRCQSWPGQRLWQASTGRRARGKTMEANPILWGRLSRSNFDLCSESTPLENEHSPCCHTRRTEQRRETDSPTYRAEITTNLRPHIRSGRGPQIAERCSQAS